MERQRLRGTVDATGEEDALRLTQAPRKPFTNRTTGSKTGAGRGLPSVTERPGLQEQPPEDIRPLDRGGRSDGTGSLPRQRSSGPSRSRTPPARAEELAAEELDAQQAAYSSIRWATGCGPRPADLLPVDQAVEDPRKMGEGEVVEPVVTDDQRVTPRLPVALGQVDRQRAHVSEDAALELPLEHPSPTLRAVFECPPRSGVRRPGGHGVRPERVARSRRVARVLEEPVLPPHADAELVLDPGRLLDLDLERPDVRRGSVERNRRLQSEDPVVRSTSSCHVIEEGACPSTTGKSMPTTAAAPRAAMSARRVSMSMGTAPCSSTPLTAAPLPPGRSPPRRDRAARAPVESPARTRRLRQNPRRRRARQRGGGAHPTREKRHARRIAQLEARRW